MGASGGPIDGRLILAALALRYDRKNTSFDLLALLCIHQFEGTAGLCLDAFLRSLSTHGRAIVQEPLALEFIFDCLFC